MPKTRSDSPIQLLHEDVLMQIISTNANIFTEHHALTNTRYASQVCRSWRATTLNSPVLWARLIDFGSFYNLKTTKWAEEVVRRSKDAPLWMIAEKKHWAPLLRYTLGPAEHLALIQHNFFMQTMHRHWERIQKLVLPTCILPHLSASMLLIYRPAPLLDTFNIEREIDFERDKKLGKKHNFVTLFSGNAPMLRHFTALSHRIDQNAPWVHSLRTLEIGMAYDICEILTVLAATPNLEHLLSATFEKAAQLVSRQMVSLPRLKVLELYLTYEEMAFALDHLSIPPECSINLETRVCTKETGWKTQYQKYNLAITSIARVAKRYFQTHHAKFMALELSEYFITIYDSLCFESSPFNLRCLYLHPFQENAPDIYATFGSREWSSITELRLEYEVLKPYSADLTFLQHLSSIETLHVHQHLLEHLTDTQDLLSHTACRKIVLFPKLRRIKIYSARERFSTSTPTRTEVGDETVLFLSLRAMDGHPISELDLTEFREPKDSETVTRLRKMKGLKVVWKPDVGRQIGYTTHTHSD